MKTISTHVELLNPALGLWCLSHNTNGYLIVRDNASLLIDCPGPDVADALQRRGLPLPELILHTQVQAEHCYEWATLLIHPLVKPKLLSMLPCDSIFSRGRDRGPTTAPGKPSVRRIRHRRLLHRAPPAHALNVTTPSATAKPSPGAISPVASPSPPAVNAPSAHLA